MHWIYTFPEGKGVYLTWVYSSGPFTDETHYWVFCRGTHYTDCVCCGQTFPIQMITQIAFICSMLCTAICMPNAIPIIQVHISNKCSLLFAWLFFIMFDIDFLVTDTAQAYVKCMLWSIPIW